MTLRQGTSYWFACDGCGISNGEPGDGWCNEEEVKGDAEADGWLEVARPYHIGPDDLAPMLWTKEHYCPFCVYAGRADLTGLEQAIAMHHSKQVSA